MKIKGFDKDLRCRDKQYEVGKEYKIELNGREMELCSDTVMHYCDSLQKVHGFYDCSIDNRRFCEIEVLGEEITDGDKCGSNHIRIIREIVGDELNQLKGLINGNTGLFNSGDMNSGDMNSGDMNSGNRNSGYRNSGDMNSGDMNSGNRNSGDMNSGNRNSGNRNSGYGNSGYRNSGNRNSGDMNSGNRNSGYRNSGYWNSGDRNSGYRNSGYGNSGYGNSGYRNSGDMNSGYRNSGYGNSGDMNSGDFNFCSYSNGVFCNQDDMNIRIFNQPSGMSLRDWHNSKYYLAICSSDFELTEWIEDDSKPRGGYLKTSSYKDACKKWWNNMTEENKEIVKSIPNFDADIFFDITGIQAEEVSDG
jgi:hypothetical protein